MKNIYKKMKIVFATTIISTASFGQTVYTFTNAGATGKNGPTQPQVDAEYTSTALSGLVTVTNGVQYWTVPQTGLYSIETNGAQGGGTNGGLGARMSGEFNLTAGTVLKILVGQQGTALTSGRYDYSGGGGSFVTDSNNNPLIVSGGGGGAAQAGALAHADTSGAGNDGGGGYSLGVGGTLGSGGTYVNQTTDGGAGITGNGGSGNPNPAPQAFINNGEGGCNTWAGGCGAEGGFGGGGGVNRNSTTYWGAGGGGGYSGGGAAYGNSTSQPFAGGGGSYNSGSNQVNIGGQNSGHGSVVITPLYNATITQTAIISCFGQSTGALSATVTGGASPYTYSWSPIGGNSANATGLPAGTYTVTITDNNGLVTTGSYTITEPSQSALPQPDLGPDESICINGQVVLNPGAGFEGYLWNTIPAGGTFDGDTTSTILLDGASLGTGTFTYMATVNDTNGCSNTDTIIVVINACTGIETGEGNGLGVILYPNPLKENVTIKIENQQKLSGRCTFVLYDHLGQQVMKEQFIDNQLQINVSELSSGIYYYHVLENEISRASEKIVISK